MEFTVRGEGLQLKYWTMPANKEKFIKSIHQFFPGANYYLAYEAGCFGYWRYDYLTDHGVTTIITPPNMIPKEDSSRVKNNRIDSKKLAIYLENGLLKKVAVPVQDIRLHRSVIRTRHQILQDQRRIQCQIRSTLLFYGIEVTLPVGDWSSQVIDNRYRLKFSDPYFEQSFKRMIDRLVQGLSQLAEPTVLVKNIALLPQYKKPMTILQTTPGVGIITAIEILLELYDMQRFATGEKVACHIGLTLKEASTREADKTRRGPITHVGNGYLRALVIELAWCAVRHDGVLFDKFSRIPKHRGKKIAIVAVALTLAVRTRYILVNGQPYGCGVA